MSRRNHRWVVEVPHVSRCRRCSLIRQTHHGRSGWYWAVQIDETVYETTWLEGPPVPPCAGFDVFGSEPRAEVFRTFLSDGMSVERALELVDLVLTEEAA